MALFKKCKKSFLRRFYRDERGNFGVLGSASVLALLLISGLTIDTMNLTQAAAELQSVTDAGVVAASADTTLSLSERNDIFQQVIDAHALQNRSLQDIEFDLSVDATSPEEVNVSVSSSAQVPLLFAEYFGKKSEVVAVSGGKADNRTVEIALALDISTSMFDARLVAMQAASKGFVEDLLTAENAKRTYVSIIPFGGTVRLPSEMIGFLNPPNVEDEIYWENGVWNGCLFMFPDDYENGINRNGNFGYMPSFYSFNAANNPPNERNPWCPREGNELVGPTQEIAKLTNTIDNFSRSDGTATGVATAWALSTLHPQFRNVFPDTRAVLPFRFNKRRRKIIVLMSDGGSSSLVFPRDNDFDTNLPFEASVNNQSIKLGIGIQEAAQLKACEYAKSLGIEIYTVGFQVSDNHEKQNLIDCATDTEHYYDSVELEDLAIAFESIAGDISAVRISQ